MGEEKRHQMMQNLFGDQSEDEGEEVESENNDALRRRPSHYPSDEGEGEAEFEGEGGEGEGEVEGQGEVHIESEEEPYEIEPDEGESESERVEKEASDLRVKSNGKRVESEEPDDFDPIFTTSTRRKSSVGHSERSDENHYAENDDDDNDRGGGTAESEEHKEYGQRAATSRRRDTITSDSEGSKGYQFGKNEDVEVYQSRRRFSPSDQKAKIEKGNAKSTADIKDVFGDSDEEEPDEYEPEDAFKLESFRSFIEDEENDDRGVRPEDVVHAVDFPYELEGDNIDQKLKEKPVGPPLELEIPLHRPPGQPDKMNIIRVSNIMGIEPKAFDLKTHVEEDDFVTDESGAKKRIRLEDNIVRWRSVQNRDGTISYESNARFVRWSDGSIQLLIGNEVLDISVQEAQHDQTHLFLRHGKGILQSQGRLLKKMRFMPSSLSSKSHRLLTALVDSRHKKVYKVKNCITDIDPEREKEIKEKAEGQTIRANELLHRKRKKISRKYSQTVERGHQLSPGFLEETLDEDDEHDDYYARHRSHRHVEEDLEEALAENRILNAKRAQLPKNIHRKSLSSGRSTRLRVDKSSESEREESEYESTGDEGERLTSRGKLHVLEDGDDESEQEAEGVDVNEESNEDEEPNRGSKKSIGKQKEIESNSDSSPRKPRTHRRRAVVYESDDE